MSVSVCLCVSVPLPCIFSRMSSSVPPSPLSIHMDIYIIYLFLFIFGYFYIVFEPVKVQIILPFANPQFTAFRLFQISEGMCLGKKNFQIIQMKCKHGKTKSLILLWLWKLIFFFFILIITYWYLLFFCLMLLIRRPTVCSTAPLPRREAYAMGEQSRKQLTPFFVWYQRRQDRSSL